MSRRLLQLVFLAVPVSAFANLSLSGDTLIWRDRTNCPVKDIRIEASLSPDQVTIASRLIREEGGSDRLWQQLLVRKDFKLQRVYLRWLEEHGQSREAVAFVEDMIKQRGSWSVDEYAILVLDQAWMSTREGRMRLWAAEDVIRPFIRGLVNTGQTHTLSPHLWVSLGDWLLVVSNRKETRIAYTAAWRGFEKASPGSGEEYFAEPSIICQAIFLSRDFVNDYDGSRGEIVMSFRSDISAKGRPGNIKLLRNHSDAFPIQGLISIARKTRFRPAMRGGEFVTAEDFEFDRMVYRGAR